MITNIIDLLNTMDFYGVSKNIDIAKGINSIPTSFGDAKKQFDVKFYLIAILFLVFDVELLFPLKDITITTITTKKTPIIVKPNFLSEFV